LHLLPCRYRLTGAAHRDKAEQEPPHAVQGGRGCHDRETPDVNYIDDLEADWSGIPNPVVTLGNFDGIHLGHQKIFEHLKHRAGALGGRAVVITFFPHPLRVLAPERAPKLITTLEERLQLMELHGIDLVICIRFTKEFARWSAQRFVKAVIVDKLRAKALYVGMDYRFGKDRHGGIGLLRDMGRQFGFDVEIIQPVKVEDLEVSSTRIRRLISAGDVRESSRLLGRFHRIHGRVVRGDGRGKALGFPTANIATEAELIPAEGVYAVRVSMGEGCHDGVASLGTNPTFSGRHFSIEAHILDFAQDIYGAELSLEFVDRIRGQKKFPDPEALARQIQDDVEKARELLAGVPQKK
jgi:riboflavin kinase/FMN adenylyltransferase